MTDKRVPFDRRPDIITLLKAVRMDSVSEFLSQHLDWVAPNVASQ